MEYSKETVGNIIKTEREKLGISQRDLGKKIGTVGKQISNYENGKLFPPIEAMVKLCSVFNCELGYLLGEKQYSKGTKEGTISSDYLGLDEKSVDAIHDITSIFKGHPFAEEVGIGNGKAMDSVIQSKYFKSIVTSIKDLSDDYNDYCHVWDKFESSFDDETKQRTVQIYKGEAEYDYIDDPDAPDLPEVFHQSIKLLDDTIDKERDLSYRVKVDKYELNESLMSMIRELFPDKNL